MDRRGVDVRVGFEIEVAEPFIPWEPCRLHSADRGASVPVVTLSQQEFGQKTLVRELFFPRDGQSFVEDRPYGGQAEPSAGLIDSRDRGLFGQAPPAAEDRGDRC